MQVASFVWRHLAVRMTTLSYKKDRPCRLKETLKSSVLYIDVDQKSAQIQKSAKCLFFSSCAPSPTDDLVSFKKLWLFIIAACTAI
jgi:hypothetical protein